MPIRKEQVCELRQQNPNWTLQVIATSVGCSREYVRYVLSQAGLPTKGLLPPPKTFDACSKCGKPANCARKGTLCSPCRRTNSLVQLVCVVCSTSFLRRRYQNRIKTAGPFCGRRCLGKWLAQHYGITKENRAKRMREESEMNTV